MDGATADGKPEGLSEVGCKRGGAAPGVYYGFSLGRVRGGSESPLPTKFL